MATLVETIHGGMIDTLLASRGVSVTYRHGDRELTLVAVRGKTVFRLDTGSGFAERIVRPDYLVKAADLVVDGQRFSPERGDRIAETRGGRQETYEVMAPGGEPEYCEMDPCGCMLRIHTALVGQEA
jgi:hypothetical protein